MSYLIRVHVPTYSSQNDVNDSIGFLDFNAAVAGLASGRGAVRFTTTPINRIQSVLARIRALTYPCILVPATQHHPDRHGGGEHES